MTRNTERMTCSRCGAVAESMAAAAADWSGNFRAGLLIEIICADCQTPDENAEAEVNLAILDYGRTTDGRLAARIKCETR